MKTISTAIILCFCLCMYGSGAGPGYWQQRVEYKMEVDLDVQSHRYTGVQVLKYFNHSPDTLRKVFYHLYYNAFQPGSAMDLRTQNIADPDFRISIIKFLNEDERGFLHVDKLTQDGSQVAFLENGTILEVTLQTPLCPGSSTLFEMQFSGQVPRMVRRAGRDNAEGVSYSMAQWYPKICVYDAAGWHPDPYISREFYGEFGDFDVKISIDKRFTVAAGGILQEPNTIGYGYEDEGVVVPDHHSEKVTWHFIAKDVHDFVWAADPDYIHHRLSRADGIVLHFFFQKKHSNQASWSQLPQIMDRALDYMNARYGQYPYPVYSFIQGGDGGMEYPMATLMTGNRSLLSLVGVSVHELLHSWFYGVLATNEKLYPWMDEGFTNHAEARTMEELDRQGLLGRHDTSARDFIEPDYARYLRTVRLDIEEPMSTHADHFITNEAYTTAAYSKGCVFLSQLEYILGQETFEKVMHTYFETWKFKHPEPRDFIVIAENVSGLVLDWYYEYWILTTKTIDYKIDTIQAEGNNATAVSIVRVGEMPMPIELTIKTRLGNTLSFYIPLELMRGGKVFPDATQWTVLDSWTWTAPSYTFTVPLKYAQIASIEIDPGSILADTRRENNILILQSDQE